MRLRNRPIDASIGAVLSDARVAGLLDVEPGAPLIEIERLMYSPAGRVLSYHRTLIPPERRRLRAILQGTIPAKDSLAQLLDERAFLQ